MPAVASKDGRYDLYEIAAFLRVDPENFRRWVVEAKGLYAEESRYCRNAYIENLLRDWAHSTKADMVELMDRWHNYVPPPPEVLALVTATGTVLHAKLSSNTDAAVRQQLQSLVDENARTGAYAKVLAQSVVDLLGVVAAQQRQILELKEGLAAATMARLQIEVANHASEHLHRALTVSAQSLQDLGRANAEVSVGAVTHKGTLTIRRATNSSEEERRRSSSEKRNERDIDVGVELKGLAAKIAGVSANVKLDTSSVDARTEALKDARQFSAKESLEGTFEVRYGDMKVRVGG